MRLDGRGFDEEKGSGQFAGKEAAGTVLSEKQKEYWTAPFHRWNIKYGATRSGKTYLDYFMIPRRIRERAGEEGRIVLLGNTRGTLERNVIDPMVEIYGPELIGPIGHDGVCRMFGEKVYCMGADSRRAVDRLRGASIKYCYGDEVVSWDEEVFGMVKSRLDRPYSCFDGTCNPKDPEHWFKKFIDSGADIFAQQYSIDDNPFLDAQVKEALKKEHRGVFFERYILGRWTVAEGLVFPEFARGPERWLVSEDEARRRYEKIAIGVDFGGYGSRTAMTAVGFSGRFWEMVVLDEAAMPVRESLDAQDIAEEFVRFYRRVAQEFGRVDHVFGDSASPTMINTLISAARRESLPWRQIGKCTKNAVSQRPVTIDRLLSTDRLKISRRCSEVVKALSGLRWDEEHPDRPEDRNSGNINDVYDSFCYCWLTFAGQIDRR